jgi:hypothetical protein
MSCNAILIGPNFEIFRSLLWRFFIEGEFQGKCWIITQDQLYKADLKKIIEKAGDKLRIKEEQEMWEGGPQIYDSGAKDLDQIVIEKAKKDGRYQIV